MHDRSYALFTGLFILVLATAIGAAGWWLADTDTQRRPYRLVTEHSVSGLSDASRVYFRGVRAGRVEEVHVAPDGEIRVRIEVDRDIPITHGTRAVLRSPGLTSISHVELDDSGEDPRALETDASDPAVIPLGRGLLDRVSDSGEAVMGDLERITGRLEHLLSDANIGHVGAILDNMETISANMIDMQQQASATLEELPQLTRDASHALQRIDALTADLGELTAGLGAIPPRLEAMSADVSAFARDGSRFTGRMERELMPRLIRTLEDVGHAADDLSRLSRQLEERPQDLLHGRQVPLPGPGERGYRTETGR